MATKDECLPYRDKQKVLIESISDEQYSNLNLNNQNHQCGFKEIRQPKNLASNCKKFQNYGKNMAAI